MRSVSTQSLTVDDEWTEDRCGLLRPFGATANTIATARRTGRRRPVTANTGFPPIRNHEKLLSTGPLEQTGFLSLLDQLDHAPRDFPSAVEIAGRCQAMTAEGDGLPAHDHLDTSSAFRAFSKLARCRRVALKQLLAAHHLLCPDTEGNLRSRGTCRIRCPATGAITYVAPDAHRVPALLDDLFGYIQTAPSDGWSPFVALLQLLVIHPFGDGNGRVARVLFAAMCWRSRLAHPALLLAVAVLYRHHATWLRAGSSAVCADGDWTVFFDRCQQAIERGLAIWSTHRPPAIAGGARDTESDVALVAIRQLWRKAITSGSNHET